MNLKFWAIEVYYAFKIRQAGTLLYGYNKDVDLVIRNILNLSPTLSNTCEGALSVWVNDIQYVASISEYGYIRINDIKASKRIDSVEFMGLGDGTISNKTTYIFLQKVTELKIKSNVISPLIEFTNKMAFISKLSKSKENKKSK